MKYQEATLCTFSKYKNKENIRIISDKKLKITIFKEYYVNQIGTRKQNK